MNSSVRLHRHYGDGSFLNQADLFLGDQIFFDPFCFEESFLTEGEVEKDLNPLEDRHDRG